MPVIISPIKDPRPLWSPLVTDRSEGSDPVLVLRTSVTSAPLAERLRSTLDDMLGAGGRWTIDFEDRDHVLRLEGCRLSKDKVIYTLELLGVECAELD